MSQGSWRKHVEDASVNGYPLFKLLRTTGGRRTLVTETVCDRGREAIGSKCQRLYG